VCAVNSGAESYVVRRDHYTENLDKLVVYVDNDHATDRPTARRALSHSNHPHHQSTDDTLNGDDHICGFVSRLNDALFKRRIHVQCARRLRGRFVYIKALGVSNRWTRLYTAVLCEVMIYQ